MNRRWLLAWVLIGWLLVGARSAGEEDVLDSESTPVWWKAGRQTYA